MKLTTGILDWKGRVGTVPHLMHDICCCFRGEDPRDDGPSEAEDFGAGGGGTAGAVAGGVGVGVGGDDGGSDVHDNVEAMYKAIEDVSNCAVRTALKGE